MTLKAAHRLQESFKAKYGGTVCDHGDLVDPLYSEKGQEIGFMVCLVCGEVYVDRHRPLSPSELEILEKLAEEEG